MSSVINEIICSQFFCRVYQTSFTCFCTVFYVLEINEEKKERKNVTIIGKRRVEKTVHRRDLERNKLERHKLERHNLEQHNLERHSLECDIITNAT